MPDGSIVAGQPQEIILYERPAGETGGVLTVTAKRNGFNPHFDPKKANSLAIIFANAPDEDDFLSFKVYADLANLRKPPTCC